MEMVLQVPISFSQTTKGCDVKVRQTNGGRSVWTTRIQVIDRRGSVFSGVSQEQIEMIDRRGRCQQKDFELFS